ncbi:MAG: acyl-CoA thioesterase [Bdellovibrionota bacterium]|nr:acyl-CoA thioesterase [Deltaproteobacteria bacterium]
MNFRMQFIEHQYDLTVLEHHLDTFGHVNNATYLQILEEARWDLITKRGYGVDVIQATGLGPVILDIQISFRKELLLREQITVHTQTQSYQKKISVISHEIKNGQGQICAQAKFTFGLFDIKTRKLVMPTEQWLYAIGMD